MSVRRRECRSYSEKARIAYAAIEVLLLRGVNTEHLRHYRNKGMAEASPTIQHYIEQYRLQDTQTLLDMIWYGVPTIISKPTKKEKAAISERRERTTPDYDIRIYTGSQSRLVCMAGGSHDYFSIVSQLLHRWRSLYPAMGRAYGGWTAPR